jgi:serine/threonine protein kinase/tetratricopeptide (TPR) repeat protein
METATAIPPRHSAARYTLQDRLGGGGQGEVWRAHDPRLGIDIALKILRPPPGRSEAAWQALLHEHASASSLHHPHIVKVYAPERDEEAFFLPMELAAGGDLRRLRRASYLKIVPVLVKVAQALDHAHEQGVIHRDLKPGNVLFDARGEVKLADFGISGRALDPGTDALIRGLSPFTASPEQLRGEPPSVADDIYGFGALAYELLSGHPPHYPNFDARRVQEQPAPRLVPAEPIPPQLDDLIGRMLAKDARERPVSMREIIDELEASINDTLTFDAEDGEPLHNMLPLTPLSDRPEAPAPRRDTPAVAVSVKPTSSIAKATSTATASSSAAVGSTAAARPIAAGPLRAVPTARSSPRPMAEQAPSVVQAPSVARAPGPAETKAPAQRARPTLTERPAQSVGPAQPVAEIARAEPAGPGAVDGAALWEEVRDAPLPVGARLEPMRSGAPRMILLLAGLAVAVLAAFIWLPNYVSTDPIARFLRAAAVSAGHSNTAAPNTVSQPAVPPPLTQESGSAAGASGSAESALHDDVNAQGANATGKTTAAAVAARSRSSFTESLSTFDRRFDALVSRGATDWAGADFVAARTRAAEAVDARDAGHLDLAQKRLTQATKLLDNVEHAAPAALAAELAAGGRALAAGQPERAQQAYGVATRIDPKNDAARDGLERVKSALDDQRYAKAAAEGYAALGAGKLDDARADFERALELRPDGAEALAGLHRLDTTGGGRTIGAMRAHAVALESQERWDEAMRVYEDLLRQDRTLTFAQEGRERTADRMLLNESMQELIDRPDRLSAPQARDQAAALLQEAQEVSDPGPELRGQVARLSALLPGIDKPVHLSLMSDNLTQVAIPSIGSFGSFTRREIQLRPGRYTVIGTREGYRDVHRDIVVSPGVDSVTVNVSCDDPI